MNALEGHEITGGTETHTMWLTCSCGSWGVEEIWAAGAPFDSADNVVAVLQRLADAGRDHIAEVLRGQEAQR